MSIFLLVFLLSCSSNVLSTKDDEIMLLKMKKQLDNPDILRNRIKGFEYCGVGFNKQPNSLVYIACTSTGRVSNLRIRNLDFLATFPYAICDLTELDSLEIYHWPGLHGPIPPCIYKLDNLRSLVITETSLSGSVPSFSKNTNIIGINLSSNHLSGTIPPSLSTLPNLHLLDLSSNYLCGEIPKGVNMGQFNAAVFANNTCLCGNPLPPCFNSAPLYAPAPAPVSTTQFDLTHAPAPTSTTLFESPPVPTPAPAPISTTLFDSPLVPTPAPASTKLFESPPVSAPTPEMPLDSNSDIYISPRDPNEEILLFKTKEQLGNPDILDRWVKGFEYCNILFSNGQDSVVALSCTDTGRVTNLRFKNLYFSAPFPEAICEFTEIETIEIYHFPGLHGPIPSCITELVNLRSIIIIETSLSGSVPNFSNNTNLIGIIISSSQLSGTIPSTLSTLPNLTLLDLSSNYLCGEIPKGGNMGQFNADVFANNACLCGNPLPPCFNTAPAPAPESATP